MKPLSIWAYVLSLALWLFLCLGAAAVVINLNIRDAEKSLARYGDAYLGHLDKEMVSNEAVLKGFSALFGVVGGADLAKISRYVRQVIETNPQIFALEILQAVPKKQLSEFVARKRREGVPNYSIKSFSYDSERKWQALKEKPVYYPIVFMEPKSSGSEEVLGLDVESVPFLQRAMFEALQRRSPVASHPFRLVEGNLAYVIFNAIPQFSRHDGPALAPTSPDELLVAMVVDAAKLAEPIDFPAFDGGTVLVHHKDFRPDDPKGQLLAISWKPRSPIENAIFPVFTYQKPLATMGEPFSLLVKRQLGWSDLSLALLALIVALTLMSSVMLVAFLRAHQQSRILNIENQNRLWQLANHDALTGLPNRMLLIDRLEQLLARAQRQKKKLAVMFLDLDDFKQVNDTYGHDIGDQLLKLVAERLRAAVRTEDTVARMSGDEFIILIEGGEYQEALEAVSQKIQQKMADGLLIEGQLIPVRFSMGTAMFPEDGDNPEALIKQADMKMYADKQVRSAKLPLV